MREMRETRARETDRGEKKRKERRSKNVGQNPLLSSTIPLDFVIFQYAFIIIAYV